VAAVLAFPGMVTHYKSDASTVDPASVTFGQDSAYGLDNYGSGDAGAAFQ
jgi:hypothetical protein